jgi:LysR family transcriptional regulator, glycine cleavage system transcriptional activator
MTRVPRLPPLHALLAFEAAARLGGFAQAAAELCITASAVSHRIRQLETLLGEPLFDRVPTGVRLNTAGQRYLQGVREAFERLSHFAVPGEAQRVQLRVGAPPTFARNLLIPALPAFYRQWPDVEIDVDIAAPLQDKPEQHDVDIRWGHGGFDGRPATKLFDDEVVVLASPAYAASLDLKAPADLARAALLRSRLLAWRPWFEAAGLDWPEPSRGPQFSDLGILLEAAASGLGVAACTRRVADAWTRQGQLQALFDVAAPSPDTYHVLARADVATRPEVAAFIDWLLATLGTASHADRLVMNVVHAAA